MQTTWTPHTQEGEIHDQAELPESVFAFPAQRKEPLTDADHVRNALARFDQVEGITDADRNLAFATSTRPPSITASNYTKAVGASWEASPHGLRQR